MRNKRGVLNAMEQPNHGHIGQGITSRWLQWYEPHEKSITFFLNVLTAFGTACAAMALIPTCVQIQQAQKTLTATTEYQISKDSAELWDSIPDDVWQHLRASGPLDLAAERQVLRIFSFVAAVQEQKQLVNTEFWKEFTDGFCGFLKYAAVSEPGRQRSLLENWYSIKTSLLWEITVESRSHE